MALQQSLTNADLEREGAETALTGDTFGVIDFTTDEDYFVWTPERNTAYAISVDGAGDFELGLYDSATLDLLAEDDDDGPGFNPLILFDTGDAPDGYLIQVDLFDNGEPGGAIFAEGAEFTLTIDTLSDLGDPFEGIDTVGDGFDTAGGLGESVPLVGAIETGGDLDFYTIFLEAGRVYRIEMRASFAPGIGEADPFLEVFDPDRRFLADDDDNDAGLPHNGGEFDAVLEIEAETTGFHFVAAQDFSISNGTGGYEIAFFETGELVFPGVDTVGDTIASSTLIEAVVPVIGEIVAGNDFDVFEVQLTEGNTYVLDVLGIDGFDAILSLLDGDGRELAFSDDRAQGNLDPLIEFTPDESAFYYLEVGGFDGDVGGYDLFVDPIETPRATTLEAHSVALLYEAGLGRQAAFLGLNFWIDGFEAGLSLVQISQRFLDSPEFERNVGDPDTLSNEAFVLALFDNVIGRPPAEAGLDFWVGRLEDGASRAQTLLAFATVPENAAQSPEVLTIAQIGQADGPADDPDGVLRPDIGEEWDFFVA